MALSIDDLTPDVIRTVARQMAAYGRAPETAAHGRSSETAAHGRSSETASHARASASNTASGNSSSAGSIFTAVAGSQKDFDPSAITPRGSSSVRFGVPEDPRWYDQIAAEEGQEQEIASATSSTPGASPDTEPPPLVRAAWLHEENVSPRNGAFWGTCERAHSLYYAHRHQSEGSATPPADATPGSQTPRSVSPGPSAFAGLAANAANRSAPESPEAWSPQGSPRGSSREAPEASNFGEFTLSAGTWEAINSQPKQHGPPSVASSKAISVDELVGRLYKAGSEYARRKVEKQEAARMAEEAEIHQPKINEKSSRLASGMQPLEHRKDKIIQKKEDKRAEAQKKLETRRMIEQTGTPTISAQAQSLNRNLQTLTRWEEQKNVKLAQRQHQKMKAELRECTFKPEICRGTKQLIDVRSENIFAGDGYDVHNRLNDDAHRRQNKAAAEAEKLVPQPHQRDKVADLGRRTDCWPANETSIMSSTSTKSKTSNGSVRRGSPTSNGSRTPGKSPRRAPEPPQAPMAAKQMSFDEFMRTLAAERSSVQKPTPHDSGISAAEARSRAAEVLPFDEFSKRAGLGRIAKVSDAEDELLLAEAPRVAPKATPPPRVRSHSPSPTSFAFAQDVSDAALPDWVRKARPEGAAPPSGSSASGGRPAANRSQSARRAISTSQPPKPQQHQQQQQQQQNENVVMYTGRFDDVFRTGYGGALPGTLDSLYSSEPPAVKPRAGPAAFSGAGL